MSHINLQLKNRELGKSNTIKPDDRKKAIAQFMEDTQDTRGLMARALVEYDLKKVVDRYFTGRIIQFSSGQNRAVKPPVSFYDTKKPGYVEKYLTIGDSVKFYVGHVYDDNDGPIKEYGERLCSGKVEWFEKESDFWKRQKQTRIESRKNLD